MGNHSERTKCSGLKGFQCGFSVWCFLACLGCAFADEDAVLMHPKGDIYVLYGDDLTIYCTASGNLTSRDLSFTIDGIRRPSEIINDTTIRLIEKKPDEHSQLTYYCKSTDNTKIDIGVVYVASPPKNVTDFKCISRNLEVLNCSWTTPDIIFTDYNLSFLVNGAPVTATAASFVPNSLLRYCYWNTTSSPRYRQLDYKYHFYLEGRNKFGSMRQELIIDHYSIVKPDPPTALRNISEGPHSVQLAWKIPINIVHFMFLTCGVQHRIEYQIAKIDNTSYFRRVDTSGLALKNSSYVFNLTDLPYAYMQYGVRVYIKPTKAKGEEFWSEFSKTSFFTASERPRRPPNTVAGAFHQNKYQDYRVIYIYWQQLEEYEEAGANFTYKVLVTYSSKTQTLKPDKSKSLSYLYLEEAPNTAIEVTILSTNDIGSSVNSSQLYIPPYEDTKQLALYSFTKLAYGNGTYELSWVGIKNIDNYTLFWCNHNSSNICSGRLNYTIIEPSKTKTVINLPRDYTYQFAISANKGTKSSGMVWAKCDISKDGIAMYGFPIKFVDHDAPGKTYVKLRWSMDCTLREGIITGYNITYCPVIGTSNTCDQSVEPIPPIIIKDPKKMDVNVTGLHAYWTYQFSMTLRTIYGLKTIENTTVRITTLEDTPSSPRHVKITEVGSGHLVISWDPPLNMNGHFSTIKYEIYNFGKKIRNIFNEYNKMSNAMRRQQLRLDNLNGYTNYSLSLSACNEAIPSCSEPTSPSFVRTRFGRPSKMDAPSYSNNILSWTVPEIPGGIVDEYEIRIVRDDQEEILSASSDPNSSPLSYYITSCEGNVKNVTFQIRAINYDEDDFHGALAMTGNITLPKRNLEDSTRIRGEWSDASMVLCRSRDNLFLLFIIMGVLAVIAIGCGVLKAYRKLRKMGDIKPEFPKGLFVSEKDPFSPLYLSDKEDKPMSDETSLLPNSKVIVPSPEIKQTDNDNCGSSDRTDSTALSDASQGVDRQNSTSDEDSHSSLHSEIEVVKHDSNVSQDETSSSADSSQDNSPYLSDNAFKKNLASGYVQPVVSSVSGYVQSSQVPFKPPPPKPTVQPSSSSYVMAGLSSPIFTTGVGPSHASPSTGCTRADDSHARSMIMFPKLGTSPTKLFGSESLPTTPTLPSPKSEDSSIQLQSLDAFPSHKLLRNPVPLKPAASSGYVSPGDVVINKHLNNIMSGAPAEESAILDPAMSPDAYCRFSWSTDPANDNLHSLLANSATRNKNQVNH